MGFNHNLAAGELKSLEEPRPPKVARTRSGNKKTPMAKKIVAKVLTETGMTTAEVGKELDMAQDDVRRALQDPTVDKRIVEQAKLRLPAKMYNVAFTIAERLDGHPEFLEKMNPYMCSLVMGIMIDKSRLMQGDSTENIEVKGKVLEIEATLAQIAELKKKLEAQ